MDYTYIERNTLIPFVMKKILSAIIFLIFTTAACAQDAEILYKKTTAMIPMRDGVKLFTVILYPANTDKKFPIIIERTPYGSDFPFPDTAVSLKHSGLAVMASGGYIFVFQDIRGKYKSEGTMQIHMPLIHRSEKGAIDEATDTYDSVDWLIKNVKNNNGNAGIYGISYPGWLALVGAVDPHPALKAASEQACMGDLFLGDDFHHNGAFRLSYGMEYSYMVENDHTKDSSFPFPQYDLFNWYINLGPLSNVNSKYFHGKIPTWNTFVEHPDYDAYWQKNSPLNYVPNIQIPMLHVGGFFDQEDMNGPQLMYKHMEKGDTKNFNHLVLGPWNHGQWADKKADSLGAIGFGANTAAWFQQLQKKWFDYYLKGEGNGNFDKAYAFQTGSNQWKTYSTWPPKNADIKKLYAGPNGSSSFTAPVSNGVYKYISDPAKPVPYRTLPIEATYGAGSRWYTWHVEDQRFVTTRPDVASFTADTLTDDLTVTGQITAHLVASTTGTDADWIVKLIDVYPAYDHNLKMSGYQLPVAMEVFRGRFRKSFSKPLPLTPGKPEEFIIDLHQINHTFKKGHRLMIQVQSTWFPVIDRNPQKYVPNIFEAKAADYIKAEEDIYYGAKGTYIEVPVIK
jgi:putative CocE/NonD family hydrolase